MTTLIKITSPELSMYVQESTEGGTLFTGNRDQARRYTPQDAAALLAGLPVKSLPGVAEVEVA